MAKDYIPSGDAEFSAWQDHFVDYAVAHWVGWGLDITGLDPLINARDAWKPRYAAHVTAQAAAQSARQAKDDQRAVCERAIREQVRVVQTLAQISDPERLAMGLTVRDRTPTPAAAPTTRPVANVDARERLRHTIHFADEASPHSKAKPAGVMGCEVWIKVGGSNPPGSNPPGSNPPGSNPPGSNPPADPSECTFLALDTRTPYVADFSGSDGGKTAFYLLRWMSTRGEKGPWSQTASATIGA